MSKVRSNRYAQKGKAAAAIGNPFGQQSSALRSGKANPSTKHKAKKRTKMS